MSRTQQLVLEDDLRPVGQLGPVGLATPNHGLISDTICCPGLDYCALANARSIPVAEDITKRFEDLKRQKEIGELELNMSGCINACGHHHVGNIGVLGVDRKGEELYQITLGGNPKDDAAIGTIIGPGFRAEPLGELRHVDLVITVELDSRRHGLHRNLARNRDEWRWIDETKKRK